MNRIWSSRRKRKKSGLLSFRNTRFTSRPSSTVSYTHLDVYKRQDKRFVDDRNRLMALLVQESSLMEIVKLIGADVLPDDQKLVLEIAKVIRDVYKRQGLTRPPRTITIPSVYWGTRLFMRGMTRRMTPTRHSSC